VTREEVDKGVWEWRKRRGIFPDQLEHRQRVLSMQGREEF
jgi:hypothetical protein